MVSFDCREVHDEVDRALAALIEQYGIAGKKHAAALVWMAIADVVDPNLAQRFRAMPAVHELSQIFDHGRMETIAKLIAAIIPLDACTRVSSDGHAMYMAGYNGNVELSVMPEDICEAYDRGAVVASYLQQQMIRRVSTDPEEALERIGDACREILR